MPSIAEILLAQGQQAAATRQRLGDISGQMWSNLGQTIGSIPAQMEQQKATQQMSQLRGLQVKQAQREDKSITAFETAMSDPGNYNPDGSIDEQKIGSSLRSHDVGAYEHYLALSSSQEQAKLNHMKTLQEIQASQTTQEEKQRQTALAQQEQLGRYAYAGQQMIAQKPDDLVHARDTTLALAAHAVGDRLVNPDQAKQFVMQTAQASPQQLSETFGQFVPPDLRAKFDAEAATTAKTRAETKKAEAEAAKAQAEAMGGGKPSPEQDTQRAVTIRQKVGLGQPVSREDLAWLKSHETEKTLGPEASAAAATDRQTATIGAQVASQRRQQDFEALKEARAAIQKDVNTPYITAKTSADTMRDVVTAAKAGNKLAGSLQSLETTMAAIRAQGLNRINATEVANAAGAGSMWDRIQGWLGKATEGQPVPPEIQKDMLSFADILERAAFKKYQQGHAATNKLYGTSIPEMLTGPSAEATPAGGGLPEVGSTFQGGKVLKVEKVP